MDTTNGEARLDCVTQGGSTQSSNWTWLLDDSSGTLAVTNIVHVAAGMRFSTDGYTVTGCSIRLTGANFQSNAITTADTVATAINSQLAGANGMFKAWAGIITPSPTAGRPVASSRGFFGIGEKSNTGRRSRVWPRLL